jgi:SAM-dependent methyltransferase
MGPVTWLDPVVDVVEPEVYGSVHPIRAVTNEIADGGGWSAERRDRIAAQFDELSDGWHDSHTTDLRLAPLDDVLARGDIGTGRLVELGAGTGAGTERIAANRSVSAAVDLSVGMLSEADRSVAPYVRGDASQLPFPDDSVDILVLVNMFLFAREAARVLSPSGRLVWVNTNAEETPIHLPPETVVDRLPGSWSAVASRAGSGLWCVARRV